MRLEPAFEHSSNLQMPSVGIPSSVSTEETSTSRRAPVLSMSQWRPLWSPSRWSWVRTIYATRGLVVPRCLCPKCGRCGSNLRPNIVRTCF